MTRDKKFAIQVRRYEFPYHYLPRFDTPGAIAIHRSLRWGLDYLTYMTFVSRLIADRLRPESLIDIGCGDGRLVNMLQGKVSRMAGVDLAEEAVRFARAFNPDVEFWCCDISEVPGRYEAATLIEVLEHVADGDCRRFVEQVAMKIAAHGSLIVSVPTTNLAVSRKHYRHYTLAVLREQLAPFFTLEEHWDVSSLGMTFRLLNTLLQNRLMIILPGKWRRAVWTFHRRYTYMADSSSGAHLIALARLSSRQA